MQNSDITIKNETPNLGGAPPFYDTPEKLQEAIDEYFEKGVEIKTVIVGGKNKEKVEIKVPTITGLTLYLGFESRQSFYDYEKRDGFSYTIKRARLRIEKEYEEALQWGNVTGAIFALKNMGWEDKNVNEVSGTGLNIKFINYGNKDGNDL